MEEKVRVIDRVFDLLELLASAGSPKSLSDISRETGMSKSTVHRLLTSMSTRSYVEKTDEGKYFLGFKLMEIAGTHIDRLELVIEAKPFLEQITRDLDLTAHLGILDGSDVVYIEKMDGHSTLQQYTQVGHRSPAFCSSIGKCILSGMSQKELSGVLDSYDLKAYTANSITDRHQLTEHLKQVRRQGWALDDEEYEINHRCIGATIFDYRGIPVAAISASGTVSQLSDEKLPKITKEICLMASKLSRRMGYIE